MHALVYMHCNSVASPKKHHATGFAVIPELEPLARIQAGQSVSNSYVLSAKHSVDVFCLTRPGLNSPPPACQANA